MPTERERRDRDDGPFDRAAERTVRRWHSPGESDNRVVRTTWKFIVLMVGATIVVGGLAMVVLPGPGFLVVIAGLAILATEFAWARALLQQARKHASNLSKKARGLRRKKQSAS